MWIYRPFLHKSYYVDFIQFEAFIASRGVGASEFWVGPKEEAPDFATGQYRAQVEYTAERYADTGPLTCSRMWMGGKRIEIRSRLGIALNLLTYLFDQPAHLDQLSDLDPHQALDQALSSLGLAREGLITIKVAAYESGSHIAPNATGWNLYLVEDYGEVVPIADCELAAPLAFVLYAQEQRQQSDISSRIVEFIPDNAAALLS